MRRSGNLLSVLLVAGLLLAGLASSHAAETRRVGNTDGKRSRPGALQAWPSSDLPTIPVTGSWRSFRTARRSTPRAEPSEPSPKGKFKGVSEGSVGEPVTCKENQTVRRLDVTMTDSSAIHSFRATCYGPGSAPQIIKATDVSGGAPGSKGIADCKTGLRDLGSGHLQGHRRKSGHSQHRPRLHRTRRACGTARGGSAGEARRRGR